jgi:hypothetical protein
MCKEQSLALRHAIENLINAKLYDALGHRDGLARLIGHRTSGVASTDIRCAEHALEAALGHCLLHTQRVPASDDRRPVRDVHTCT